MGTIELKHFWGQLLGSYAIIFAWALTPWGLTSLIVGVLTTNLAILRQGKKMIDKKVRGEVGRALAENVRNDADSVAERCAEQFGAELTTAIDLIVSRMDIEVRQLRAQVDDALAILAEGEDAVRLRQDRLAQWDSDLDKNSAALEDLIADVEQA